MTENELKAQIALWQNRALGAQALVYEAVALLDKAQSFTSGKIFDAISDFKAKVKP